MKKTCLTLLASAALSACATQETARDGSASAAPATSAASVPATSSASRNDAGAQVTQAVATPLNDLNLVRADIPAALVAAEKGPYAVPTQPTCPGITADVQALDAALGPDLDTPASPNNPSLVERGTGAAGNAAVGALRSTAENVIPFRGWVRKLSGAERYTKQVSAAITAGGVRRGYLRGLSTAKACTAAPARAASAV
jgi:hypothetical protein